MARHTIAACNIHREDLGLALLLSLEHCLKSLSIRARHYVPHYDLLVCSARYELQSPLGTLGAPLFSKAHRCDCGGVVVKDGHILVGAALLLFIVVIDLCQPVSAATR